MIRPSHLVLAVALCAPIAAQSPLVVKTTHAETAHRLLEGLGGGTDLPELGEGMVWRVAMDDGGVASAEAVAGEVSGLVELEVRPAQLMEMFAERVAQAQQMAQGFAAMGLAQAGVKTADAVKMVRAVFGLPKQIDRATVKVDADPDHPEAGAEVDVRIEPKAGTWLAGLVSQAMPSGQGVPALGDAGAVLRIQYDVDVPALAPSLEGATKMLVSMGSKSEEVTQKRLDLMQRYYKALGSVGAVSWDQANGLATVSQLADPAAVKEISTDPEFLGWTKDMQGMMPGQESEVTPNALTHRDVAVTKTLITTDEDAAGRPGMPPNPLMRDGRLEGYNAVAGDYLVSLVSGGESDAKELIDRVLDGKLGTTELPAGTILAMTFDIAQLSQMMGGETEEDAPKTVSIDVQNTGNSLGIKVVAR